MKKAKEARLKLGLSYQHFTNWQDSRNFDWPSMGKDEKKGKKKEHVEYLNSIT